jgi:hypothetical protein
VLTQALDTALVLFGSLRSKIDEVISIDVAKEVKTLWIPYRGVRNPYMKRINVAAIDSGYNYKEFRGYALYIQNTAWIHIDSKGGEQCNGIADVDVISTSNIEYELSLLSIAREVEAMSKLVTSADIILVDGSAVAMFSKLRRAMLESEHELLDFKGIKVSEVLKNFLITLSLYPRKFVFLSKNSTAKDILGFVKGDIYYFERYTEGLPGYTKPLNLTQSKHMGIALAAKMFTHSMKSTTGIKASIYMSYVRFEPYARVYRVELVGEFDEPVEPRIRYLIDVLSIATVSGYPYPLMRADQIAKVSNNDVERVVAVLGVMEDPYSREPI